MICCHYIIVLLVLCLILEVGLFELRCPENMQRHLRVKSFCNASSHDSYACLFDEHTHAFIESCSGPPNFVRPGHRYGINGRRTNINCSSSAYQPFKLWSHKYSNCVFVKSKCNEIGLILIGDPSTTHDNNCRCDHTDSYAFFIQPRNKCYCIPSEEDCTCYRKTCPKNSVLSSDYHCISMLPSVDDSICQDYTHSRKTTTTDKISVETNGKEQKDRPRYISVSYASFPCGSIIGGTTIVCCILCVVAYCLNIGKYLECSKEKKEFSRSLSVIKASTAEKSSINYNCSVSARSITLTWDNIKIKDQYEIDHFIIKYRESVGEPFNNLTVSKKEKAAVIYDLKSNTMYEIELHWCDNKGTTHQFLNPNEKTNKAFAEVLTKQATKIDNVYLLKPKCIIPVENTGDRGYNLQVDYVDMIEGYKQSENLTDEKTLIVVGAKGAGRSTLINALINHILEVSYSDDHRFAIVDHTTSGQRDMNQLTEYRIPKIKGSRVNFKLNIIQTPDINDSNNGLNEEMKKYITALCDKYTNRYIAILVVIPSSTNQLTDGQRHVLSGICRDNIADRVFLTRTFRDQGNTKNCFDSEDDPKIHYTHLLEFDNSNVLDQCCSDDKNVNEDIWSNRRQTFNQLFEKLEETG